jgi:chromate transporter
VHGLARHAIQDAWLMAAAVASFVAALAAVPFIVTLGAAGVACALVRRGHRAVGAVVLAALVMATLVTHLRVDRRESRTAAVTDAGGGRASMTRLLASGLKAGLLTFGGAYTAIPFLQHDAVERGGWMTTRTFLDGLALGGILPAPLIIFSTFVGFVAGGPLGALAMTLGVFLPAFCLTLLGHDALERIVARPGVHGFLDGVTAGVVGLIGVTLAELLRAGVTTTGSSVLFGVALLLAYLLRSRWSVAVIVLGAGAAGWVAFASRGLLV